MDTEKLMADFADMTTVNKLKFLVDEYEKGNWRRHGQVKDACQEAIDELERAATKIDDLSRQLKHANGIIDKQDRAALGESEDKY